MAYTAALIKMDVIQSIDQLGNVVLILNKGLSGFSCIQIKYFNGCSASAGIDPVLSQMQIIPAVPAV